GRIAGARDARPPMPRPLAEPDRSTPLRDRILAVVALYPEPRSAIIPALRLAQEEHGWLSTEAFEQVADATGFTPALCRSVASFYDMFRLDPVGRHEICVCTNISCALVGAGETLRAFEQELGVLAGETTGDGMFSLKIVECYGGCGWGPPASADERYPEPLPADQLPELTAKLRG